MRYRLVAASKVVSRGMKPSIAQDEYGRARSTRVHAPPRAQPVDGRRHQTPTADGRAIPGRVRQNERALLEGYATTCPPTLRELGHAGSRLLRQHEMQGRQRFHHDSARAGAPRVPPDIDVDARVHRQPAPLEQTVRIDFAVLHQCRAEVVAAIRNLSGAAGRPPRFALHRVIAAPIDYAYLKNELSAKT